MKVTSMHETCKFGTGQRSVDQILWVVNGSGVVCCTPHVGEIKLAKLMIS
jgi:hypothetical protein